MCKDHIMKYARIAFFPVLFFSCLAYAEDNNFDGPYIGAGLGINEQRLKVDNTFRGLVSVIQLDLNLNLRTTSAKGSALGNINLGYSKRLSASSFLAVEAMFNLYSLKNSLSMSTLAVANGVVTTRFNEKITVKRRIPSVGLAVKPGILIGPCTAFYGLAGIELARFTVSSIADFMQNVGGVAMASAASSKTSNNVGLRLGTGIESYVHDKVKVGLEYTYIYFGKIKAPTASGNFTGASNGVLAIDTKIKASNNALILKLTYDF